MSAEFDTGFFVRKPAWHGEGLVTDRAPQNWDEARKWAGLEWEPTAEPVYGKVVEVNGDEIVERYEMIEGFQRVARSDTGATLSVPRGGYHVISHAAMGEIVEAVLDEPNMSYETAGSLAGGRKVWALVKLDEPYQVPGDPSLTFPYGAIMNAHDGSAACKVNRTTVRIVCANTYSASEAESERSGLQYVFRHTGNWRERVEQAKDAVSGIRSDAARWREIATELALMPVSARQREIFVREFIPSPPDGIISDRVRGNIDAARGEYRKLLDSVTCAGVEHTAYGLVLAAGEYLDHVRGYRNRDTLVGRQLLKPQTLKGKAVNLAREVALSA